MNIYPTTKKSFLVLFFGITTLCLSLSAMEKDQPDYNAARIAALQQELSNPKLDVDSPWQTNDNILNTTILMASAQTGNIPLLQAALARTKNVDTIDNLGRTALGYAVIFGHPDAAQKLIDAKANVDHKDAQKVSLLRLAVLNHNKNPVLMNKLTTLLMQELTPLPAPAKVATPTTASSSAAASAAAVATVGKAMPQRQMKYIGPYTRAEIIKRVKKGNIDFKRKITCNDGTGGNILHWAIAVKDPSLFDLVLKHGDKKLDFTQCDSNGRTPVTSAIANMQS